MRIWIAAAAAAGLALAGCGEKGDGLSAEENRELANAAGMVETETLDASPDSLVPDDEAGLGNGEEESAEGGDVVVVNETATNEAANRR